MSTVATNQKGPDDAARPQLQLGLVEELTAAYAAFLKQQRTTSAAYVRWTPAHSRAHEFAWLDPGQESLLLGGGSVTVGPTSQAYSSVQKMMATIELNPYERELRYGYPYVIGYASGKTIRAPLLSIAIAITTDRDRLVIATSEDVVRFNSLPFRTETDTSAQELALARLIEQTPALPLTSETLVAFCGNVTRELHLRLAARLNGLITNAPVQPRSAMDLTIVDNAACFIAPKSSYFLVSDLEKIGRTGPSPVTSTALGWFLGKRPPEPTSDRFEDRGKLFYPFPSNPSQRRVAHLVDDPKTRIAVIEGPPGTGKSLTIANLVCHLVATGKRVLITSQKDKALEVVDDLLRGLDLGQLPMTLLRQDRESKQQLRERLDSIQKERSSEEARSDMERQAKSHAEVAENHKGASVVLEQTLMAEHNIELVEKAVKNTRGRLSRLLGKWKLRKTLRAAERKVGSRSDAIGDALRNLRERLRVEAAAVLEKAAEHRTSVATKAERNQLREFAKLLGRNQASFKNYPVFDRLKAEPERCNMLLKILPCWIMTPDDVARLFPCEPGLFDVVIIDEASQCDLPSMTPVLFRAKQAVIAGDSKQMQSQRFAFTASQVSAQAWVERGLDRLDPDRWLDPSKIDLLQLASIRMDEQVFLDEHYRSLPPIIGFSNEHWYRSRLRIMRDHDDRRFGDPDSAAITLHRVHGKVTSDTQENEMEARALIEHLRGMLGHPAYAEASFGVICLFQEQMRLVNDMVAEQIPDQLRTVHDLVVVNPDGFQGDERDIILYSLSYDSDGMTQAALSARQADREHIQGMLNVAFTRARDEIHIFHSADVNQFATASGSGAIKEWLEYCSQHCGQARSEGSSIEVQIAKAQSEFETQVISALAAKGATIRAQYPCCGYSIDCVAELEGSRVAIECDGEIWHLDEHGKLKTEDLLRQEVLERAGWKVLRIPYRSWREDAEMQLERILNELRKDPTEASQPPEEPPAASAQTLYIDKFENALLKALRSGNRSRETAFKVARAELGYSRLGQQIRIALTDAADRLERRKIIKVEEDEAFFRDDATRDALYEVKNPAPSLYSRPKQRYRRRTSFRRYY
jgi:very-short-patch-repair endonuclease/KaiC/GvpD/RAD55 family RecA-like ATPase